MLRSFGQHDAPVQCLGCQWLLEEQMRDWWPFHKDLRCNNLRFDDFCPFCFMFIQSQWKFAHAMTALLSWHVQNFIVIEFNLAQLPVNISNCRYSMILVKCPPTRSGVQSHDMVSCWGKWTRWLNRWSLHNLRSWSLNVTFWNAPSSMKNLVI